MHLKTDSISVGDTVTETSLRQGLEEFRRTGMKVIAMPITQQSVQSSPVSVA